LNAEYAQGPSGASADSDRQHRREAAQDSHRVRRFAPAAWRTTWQLLVWTPDIFGAIWFKSGRIVIDESLPYTLIQTCVLNDRLSGSDLG
jgi:hypothetical protein